MGEIKWSQELDEKLYFIACEYDKGLRAHDSFTADSFIVKKIHSEFNVNWATPSSVLYRLAEFKFFKSKRNSRKDAIFYRQAQNITVNNFKIIPKFKDVSQQTAELIIATFLERIVGYSLEAKLLTQDLAKEFDVPSLHIQKILHDKGIIQIQNPPRMLMIDRTYIEQLSVDNGAWKKRVISPEIRADIDACRAKLGKYYNPSNHSLPSIIRSSDGTGFGKSYSVFKEYICNKAHEPDIRHRCMVFTTPQKSQIDIPQQLLAIAKEQKMPVLPVLGRDDLRSLDFIDWVDEISNEVRYLNWTKLGKDCPYMKTHLGKLKGIIGLVRRSEQYLVNAKSPQERALYEQQLISLKYELGNLLESTALSAINQFDQPVTIDELKELSKSSEIQKLRLEIIARIFPFQIALVEPCVLVLTSDKFDMTTNTLEKRKDGAYKTSTHSFAELIGGSKKPKKGLSADSEIAKVIEIDDFSHASYLKEQYFKVDEKNPFVSRNIAFTVILDEEHEAYERFRRKGTIELVNAELNLPHVFSALNRALKSIRAIREDEAARSPLYEDVKAFFDNVKQALNLCDISEEQSMESLLELFESNLGHVQIDRTDAEQILNITRNLFNFSPKHFFNEQALKNIKVSGHQNNTYCKLFYSELKSGYPTLHDYYQLTMALLDAASKVTNSDLELLLGTEFQWSQNSPLSQFIRNARKNKDSIKFLFDRIEHINTKVDHFFTYFQPKTVFSIQPKPSLLYNDVALNKFIYVDFTLSLIKELPESSVIRLTRRPHNAIYLLSATTGFNRIYNGNFNFEMLKKYGQDLSNNLSYGVVKRQEQDLIPLDNLRASRAKVREVSVNSYDEGSEWITSSEYYQDIESAVKCWENKLQPGKFIMVSKYRRREFRRILHAIMLSAHDRKSALVLSLSKRFFTVLENYVISTQNSCKRLRYYEDEDKSIYSFEPFDNGNVLRLICFSSPLTQSTNVHDYTKLLPTNETLVMVAAYQSAGTGLNYFVRYVGTHFKEDFTRLVLANSPFYSEVRKPSVGLNTLDNWLTLMKYYSDSDSPKLLKDFDVNLINNENYHVLEREHQMSIFKKVMQAVGRVEREDTLMHTELYIPSNLMAWMALHFSRLSKDENNEMMLKSMSLLNTAIQSKALIQAERSSFSSEEERKDFELKIINDNRLINKFFDKAVRADIAEYRNNKTEPDLNEVIRDIDCVFNPRAWLEKLLNTNKVKSSQYLQSIINTFFISPFSNGRELILCRSDLDDVILTDISNASVLYSPAESLFPVDVKGVKDESGIFWQRYNELSSLRDTAFKELVPHPALLPLLKGNIGEYLLDAALEQIGIRAMSLSDFMASMPSSMYELFDRYIEFNGELICIDAKNWSLSLEQGEQAVSTIDSATAKRNTIQDLLGHKYKCIKFAYVNTRIDQNPLNLKQENNENETYYFNLLKEEHFYQSSNRSASAMDAEKQIVLSSSFIELFLEKV